MKITGYWNTGEHVILEHTTSTFPGGEEHIRFEPLKCTPDRVIVQINITAKLTDSKSVMSLLLAVNALRGMYGPTVMLLLTIPYFPYARQDRICATGEAFGLKMMCELINTLKAMCVTVVDPHSDVLFGMIENVKVIDQLAVVKSHQKFLSDIGQLENSCLLAPDFGAMKKTSKIADAFYHETQSKSVVDVFFAEKERDLATGDIIRTVIHGDLTGRNVIIIDDICDGGRTFIEIAKVLKEEYKVASISLFVTHGIFSKGLEVFDGLIDNIYTTDSVTNPELDTEDSILHISKI